MFISFLLLAKRSYRRERENTAFEPGELATVNEYPTRRPYQTYYGEELNFSDEELTAILT